MDRPKRVAAQAAIVKLKSLSKRSSDASDNAAKKSTFKSSAQNTGTIKLGISVGEDAQPETASGRKTIPTSRVEKSVVGSTRPSVDVLPHGLGIDVTRIQLDKDSAAPLAEKQDLGHLQTTERQRAIASELPKTLFKGLRSSDTEPVQEDKKVKKALMRLGESPYPYLAHPTSEEAREVEKLLSSSHGKVRAPEIIPIPSKSVAGCGEVNFALEALVRTIISAHTSMGNANRAMKGIAENYRVFTDGINAGCVDWNQVRRGGREKLEGAIRGGGMQKMKSRDIMKTLEIISEENQRLKRALCQRLGLAVGKQGKDKYKGKSKELAIRPAAEAQNMTGDEVIESNQPKEVSSGAVVVNIVPVNETENYTAQRAKYMAELAFETLLSDEEVLTIDYIHAWPVNQAFGYLQTFPSVGVKTAACVLLFCMQRPLFAVDTHVFRISKWLGWAPVSANRDQVFFHCDVRVPDDLKYKLHQLLIVHGKVCVRCSAASGETHPEWNETECCLEHLLKRTGEKKGGGDTPRSKGKRKARQVTEKIHDDEEEYDTVHEQDTHKVSHARKAKKADATKQRKSRVKAENRAQLRGRKKPEHAAGSDGESSVSLDNGENLSYQERAKVENAPTTKSAPKGIKIARKNAKRSKAKGNDMIKVFGTDAATAMKDETSNATNPSL